MSVNPKCFVVAVSGGKGGVGKSTVAANLASSIVKEMRAKTLLIDLDAINCGDQNILLGARVKNSLNESENAKLSLRNVITSLPSGLNFLSGVGNPEQKLSVLTDYFLQNLYSLSSLFQFIIIDVGHQYEALQESVLLESHATLLVTQPDALSVMATKKKISELLSLSIQSGSMQVVVNQVSSQFGLNPAAIGQHLQRNIIAKLPKEDARCFDALRRSQPFVTTDSQSPLAMAYKSLVHILVNQLSVKLKEIARLKTQTNQVRTGASSNLNSIKSEIHKELIVMMNLKKDLINTKGDPKKEKELQVKSKQAIVQLTDKLASHLSRSERASVIQEVVDEALGLGPLEALLKDDSVTEIMVNGHDKVYVEKNGRLNLIAKTFTSNLQLKNVIERICSPLGRRIDEKTPYVDARLVDGSRVNAVIEPLAIDGPSLTIRKFPKTRITVEDYVQTFQSLTQPMSDLLRTCVEQGLNIIISGGTGSGKTTMLNVLSGFIPHRERIVTIEDAAELQLKQDHVVRLETRPPNIEGEGAVSIRDLVKNSLRMRPDRIIVGECRDGAALDMVSAMNTGHDGSMTTVHANSPREAVSRLETLCMMAGMELPAKSIREQISGAVNLILQISRLSDGSRKVMSLSEVVGMQGDVITLQEIFRFKEEGFDKNRKVVGRFQASGLIPSFIETFEKKGIKIPRNLFITEDKAPVQQPTGQRPVRSSSKASMKNPTPFVASDHKSTTSKVVRPPLKKVGS